MAAGLIALAAHSAAFAKREPLKFGRTVSITGEKIGSLRNESTGGPSKIGVHLIGAEMILKLCAAREDR